MKNTKKLVLVGSLSLALFLTACGGGNGGNGGNADAGGNAPQNNTQAENNHNHESNHNHENNHGEDHEEAAGAVTMADWDGTWNNMGAYLDKEELQGAFEELGKKENSDAATAKAAYVEKRKCDFNGMIVEGDMVTFLDNFKDDGGKEVGKGEYAFLESKEAKHGNHTLEWDIFEAKTPDAPYKYLLMMPIHGEETLTHFHMRYGDDKDALLAKEGWFPTFVKPTTTMDQLVDEITE